VSLQPTWALRGATLAGILWLGSCGGGGGSSPGPTPPPASPVPYLPLKVGDVWTYACYLGTPAPGASAFPKTNQVLGTVTVNGTLTYEYAQQLPSSPTNSTTQIQLLANDGQQNTVLYGYMANPTASPQPVTPTVIVAQHPGGNGSVFDYPSEAGGVVSRFFFGNGVTNPTVFGVLPVSEYFEGSHNINTATDGYGYLLGRGVMEEDHNFNTPQRIDCIITATPAP